MFAKLRRRDTLPPPVTITDEYLHQILVELRILNNCPLPEDPDPNVEPDVVTVKEPEPIEPKSRKKK